VGALVLLAVALTLMTGCEPTGWDLVLAPPPPVEHLQATYDSAENAVNVTYTVPEPNAIQEYLSVVIYYRLPPSDDRIYLDAFGMRESPSGEPSYIFSPPAEMAVGGDAWVIVVTRDDEYQPSEPVEVLVDWTP